MSTSSHHRRRRSLADWFGLSCLILLFACSAILLIRLLDTGMLTTLLVVLLVAALLILNLLHLVVQLPRRRSGVKVGVGLVALVLSCGMLYAVSAAGNIQTALMNITGNLSEVETTYVLVLKEDEARDIGDAIDYRFGSLAKADKENTTALLAAIKDGLGSITNTPCQSVSELVDTLYSKKVDAIILNQGYVALLEKMDGYASFSQDTRILYEFTTTKEVEPITPNAAITREPFVVYCSGIDSHINDINVTSLSDVNILAVVNPVTHQVLLLNTPRDYYVPMVSDPYAGERDKLTHAGAVDIEESMAVLGQLYGLDVDYFVRVNFFGMIDIVDALGGIEVDSPVAFTTIMNDVEGVPWGEYTFYEGSNTLNGVETLAFARERQLFEEGDNQRGQNQMAVIRGIVNKATSPAILSTYADLLKAVEGCFTTNMHYEDISALVKMQLRDMSGWNITSYAVSGEGDMQPCASYGNEPLWVMWPDEEMIDAAKTMVQQVLRGEVPVEPVLPQD